MDSVRRFDDRVEDYAAHRPSYPSAAIDAMLEGLGFPALLTVADIGAGTGIMARLIAGRGSMVVAVEPSEAMRAAGEDHERIIWQDGTAEATGLREGSVNLVVCAQSFHWFDRASALAEFRRILRSTGRLALVWNEVDTRDPLASAYRRLVDDAATDDSPRRRYAAEEDPFAGDTAFGGVAMREFPYEQAVTADGLVGRALSASYVPKAGPAREALETALRAAHAEHAEEGRALLRYRTIVWTAGGPGRLIRRVRPTD